MFSLVLKSLHKGGVIAKIVDGFERAVLLLSPFQFCGSSSQKQLKICKILPLWKAESSQSLTEFCWTWWELGTQRCCVTYFSTLLSPFSFTLLLILSLCLQALVPVGYVQVCIGGRRRDFTLFVDISILNIYRLSWQGLTKGVIFSTYFVCWILSYRILLAKY